MNILLLTFLVFIIRDAPNMLKNLPIIPSEIFLYYS